jgi:4,5-dihydroxyphthalate decarboxylase
MLKISLASERYDRVQAIFDGRVRIEGCDVTAVPLHAEEAFHRAFNARISMSPSCPPAAT